MSMNTMAARRRRLGLYIRRRGSHSMNMHVMHGLVPLYSPTGVNPVPTVQCIQLTCILLSIVRNARTLIVPLFIGKHALAIIDVGVLALHLVHNLFAAVRASPSEFATRRGLPRGPGGALKMSSCTVFAFLG